MAVNDGGAPDPAPVVCRPSGLANPICATLGQHDVPRLQVTVDNALPVRHGQRLRDGDPNLEDFVHRHRTFAKPFG
jgi:hypothetical protein